MKGTDQFKAVIQKHLVGLGEKDPLFAETLKKPNKNIDSCINYILDTVKKSGINGFADDEVYGMAVHYYDEDNITASKATSAAVIVNHSSMAKGGKQKDPDKVVKNDAKALKGKTATKKTVQKSYIGSLFD